MNSNQEDQTKSSKGPNVLDEAKVDLVKGNSNDVTIEDTQLGKEVMARLEGSIVNVLPDSMKEGTVDEQPVSVPIGLTVVNKTSSGNGLVEVTLKVDSGNVVKHIVPRDRRVKIKQGAAEAPNGSVSPLQITFGIVILIEAVVIGWLLL